MLFLGVQPRQNSTNRSYRILVTHKVEFFNQTAAASSCFEYQMSNLWKERPEPDCNRNGFLDQPLALSKCIFLINLQNVKCGAAAAPIYAFRSIRNSFPAAQQSSEQFRANLSKPNTGRSSCNSNISSAALGVRKFILKIFVISSLVGKHWDVL